MFRATTDTAGNQNRIANRGAGRTGQPGKDSQDGTVGKG
jgi:hypothetical protein